MRLGPHPCAVPLPCMALWVVMLCSWAGHSQPQLQVHAKLSLGTFIALLA